jgi:hypothetical protein
MGFLATTRGALAAADGAAVMQEAGVMAVSFWRK